MKTMATHITIPAHLNFLLDEEMIFLNGIIPKSKEDLIKRIYTVVTWDIRYVLADSLLLNNYFLTQYSFDYKEYYDSAAMALNNMVKMINSPIHFIDGTARLFVKNHYEKKELIKRIEIYFSYPRFIRERILFKKFIEFQKEKLFDYVDIINYTLAYNDMIELNEKEVSREDLLKLANRLKVKHSKIKINSKNYEEHEESLLYGFVLKDTTYAIIGFIVTADQHTKIICINMNNYKSTIFSMKIFDDCADTFNYEIPLCSIPKDKLIKAYDYSYKEKFKGYSSYKFNCDDYDKLMASVKYFKDYIHFIKEKDNSYLAFGIETDIFAFLKFSGITTYKKIK